jgi:hypothetical protein
VDSTVPTTIKKGQKWVLEGHVTYNDPNTGEQPIESTMAVSILLNFTTAGEQVSIGTGWADKTVGSTYGHFAITCEIPGASPSGAANVIVKVSGNEFYQGGQYEF